MTAYGTLYIKPRSEAVREAREKLRKVLDAVYERRRMNYVKYPKN